MNKCIIVDDEQKSVNTISTIITSYLADKLEIVGTANSADEAFTLINEVKPKLIFLDIEMPHGSGFDLLERFDVTDFEVIFTTGFAQYAITAIKFSALDYLLKPIDIQELIQSVDKAIDRMGQGESDNNMRLKLLLENLKTPKDKDTKIPLPVLNGLSMVKIRDIVYCQADEDYTHVFLKDDNQKLVVTKSIKDFEDLLKDYDFFRLHHSFLVNKSFIKKYTKGEGGHITTELGHEIPVSRRRKVDFLSWLSVN